MSSRHTSGEFTQLAEAFGLNVIDAANHVLELARQGRQLPRWMRRAARTITRRARAARAVSRFAAPGANLAD
jgi:hypothetical protein